MVAIFNQIRIIHINQIFPQLERIAITAVMWNQKGQPQKQPHLENSLRITQMKMKRRKQSITQLATNNIRCMIYHKKTDHDYVVSISNKTANKEEPLNSQEKLCVQQWLIQEPYAVSATRT